MIRIVLVDDDVNSQKAAAAALEKFPEVSIIKSLSAGEELFDFLKEQKPDLIVLDIELDGETGFQIAKKLHDKYPDLLFLFLTGHASYAIDGYGFHPVDFLTKPIREEKLKSALEEVEHRLGRAEIEDDTEIMFRLGNGYSMAKTSDICLIERRNRRNIMVLTGGEKQIGRYSMKELEDMLEPHGFFLCHQSFLVNLKRILSIQNEGKQQYSLRVEGYFLDVPLARGRYDELVERMKDQGKLVL